MGISGVKSVTVWSLLRARCASQTLPRLAVYDDFHEQVAKSYHQ